MDEVVKDVKGASVVVVAEAVLLSGMSSWPLALDGSATASWPWASSSPRASSASRASEESMVAFLGGVRGLGSAEHCCLHCDGGGGGDGEADCKQGGKKCFRQVVLTACVVWLLRVARLPS